MNAVHHHVKMEACVEICWGTLNATASKIFLGNIATWVRAIFFQLLKTRASSSFICVFYSSGSNIHFEV